MRRIDVVVLTVLIAIVIASCYGYTTAREERNGYVRRLSWEYTVSENEDYKVQVCDEDGCESKNKTRVTRKWVNTGYYPDSPSYPDHSIASGRYASYSAWHTVSFMSEGERFAYYTYNLREYSKFKPEQVYRIHVNYFGIIIKYKEIQ